VALEESQIYIWGPCFATAEPQHVEQGHTMEER